jgi:hypothetical protein
VHRLHVVAVPRRSVLPYALVSLALAAGCVTRAASVVAGAQFTARYGCPAASVKVDVNPPPPDLALYTGDALLEATGCGHAEYFLCRDHATNDDTFDWRCWPYDPQPVAPGTMLVPSKLTPDEAARLPQVAQEYGSPPLAEALRGLTIRPRERVVGAHAVYDLSRRTDLPYADPERTCADAMQARWTDLGWTVVTDASAPVDLDVAYDCPGHVQFALVGDFHEPSGLEVRMPEGWDGGAILFTHDGELVERIADPPGDVVCPIDGGDLAPCRRRLREMARAYVLDAIVRSTALRELVRKRRAGAAGGQVPR